MRRMKKLTALMLAVLLMMQLLPVSAAAENPEEVISDVYTAPVYHAVTFTAEGEEVASLFVNDGAAISRLPDAPEVEGKTFTGWFIGETPVTAETAVTEDLTVTAVYTETEAPAPENGALAEGKDYYLTGKLPDGIVEVVPVTVEIAGAEVLAACDVRVTAARKLLAKGEAEQAENGAMQLHFYQEAFASEIVDIYRMADAESPAEYITTVKAENGWVTFDADASAIYAVVRTKLTKTVTTSDGATYEIEVTYKNTSGIPMDGTDLLVSEIREGDAGYDAYISASADKLGINPESIEISRAFDISIVDEADHNIVYEPSGEVDVSITLAGSALYEYAAVDVVHLVGDENTKGLTAYDMNSTVTGETVRFTTDSFSVYVVVGEVYLRTYRFYTLNEYGDYTEYVFENDTGAVTFTQSIKNGETPVVPGSPANPQDPTAVFAGWYQGDGSMEPVFDDNASPYDFDNIPEITGNEVVYLYARFLSYAYVIFHDQFDAETGTYPVAYTERAELINGSASVSISGKHVVYSNGKDMVFSGWADEDGEPVQTEEGKIKVTGTTHLYPLFSPVFWLSFDSGPTGSGATYYPETYYLNGEGPSTLADHIPTRDGNYTFDGWFTGADGTGTKIAYADGSLNDGESAEGISVTGGKIKLTADVKLYAKWTVRTTADYTIVIQKLKALEGNTTDYEFAESFSRSGTIGDTISVDNPYKELNDYTVYNALHPDAGVTEDTNPYKGYAFNETKSDTSVEIKADSSSVLNIYYDWSEMPDMTGRTYTLTFADSVETAGMSSPDLPVVYNQAEGDHAKVAYNAVLEGYEPDAAPASGRADYTFTGWFADKACTIRVFFTQETYNAFTGNKVLFETMPGRDLTVYAGWEKLWFVVTIDPNYGAMYAYNSQGILEGTGSTWFWSAYGDKIQEYTTVTRNFVESDSGTYYYVNHAGDGTGSSVWPDRYTYYTTNPSEATGFTTFTYKPGIYRYDGWYEVKEDGSEEPYDFSKIVDHNITLKLHWTKVGAFYLQYVAGDGTLNGEEELEPLYVELDGGSYADNAEVVITRSATAPDGYVFVGWTIRGDVSGTVYRPGQTFTLLTSYAATVQGKETVFLEAVYTKVPTASIIYHANGGTIEPNNLDYGSLADPVEPEDQSKATPLSGNYDITEEDSTATVTGLANNSKVYLSGSGFIRDDAEFAGWCSNRVYDADDESAPLFVPNTLYGVDVEGNNDLYAIWQVSVNYHLNNEDPDADFGGDWGTDYTLSGKTYTHKGYLDSTVKYPPYDPLCAGQEFLYWATKDGEDYTQYDFSQQLTGELDLYAVWGKTGTVRIHAVDVSSGTFVEVEEWVIPESRSISIGESGITMDASAAAEYVNPTGGSYEFAYAVVSDSIPDGEDNHVQTLNYNSADNKIYIDGTDTSLADGEELWFVFNSASESSIEVHVAQVDVSGGSISKQDNWRGSTTGFTLVPGERSSVFTEKLPSTTLVPSIPSEYEGYAFGAIFYGTGDDNDGTDITPAGEMNVVSVAYEPVKEGSNVYAIYLKDGNGKRLTELNGYNIYYLYYPKLTVHYLKETDNGVLTKIEGAEENAITYGGAVLTMNGAATVAQNQKVEVPSEGLTISQSVGSGNFNIPPLLDEGTNQYNLVYYKLGALAQSDSSTAISNIAELNGFVSEGLTLYMDIVENRLSWSFTGDEDDWTGISNWPVVYAIYRERGYDLTITKTVPIDTGYQEPFTITVSSTAITRSTYAVEGTGSNKIDAVPASGSEPGKIEFPVTDGSSVKIIGLGAGSYTISETDNDNYILTVKIGSDSPSVVDNSKVTLTLAAETKLDLTNTPQYICQVGYRKFYTITSAVEWIEENSADFSGTIEMLVDNYLMPSSDAPVIPDYLNITLTSAEGTKTITRKDSFTSNAMFTNSGVFTLQNITLDGNSVSASGAMIDNEGTLTVDSDATLTNAVNTGNGGAVNSWSGTVTVANDATITNCKAESGGAIYASGGTVTVSGGTLSSNSAENGGAIYYAGSDSVTVSGGALEGNKAENGGAVYMSTGTLSVSGGSMSENEAAENGGAVYAANAAVTISGGTIGGADNGNSAANGGAVYAEAGSVTVSGGTVSYNTATANGGAVYANTATVSVSGGSITSNTAAENGGAVYAKAGTVTVSKGTIDSNSAANGGGIYADSGAVTLSSDNGTTVLNGNTAVSGNGGAVYAASGAVSADKVKFTANHADSGNGGALWIGTGSATLSTCTMDTDNSAVNGAAVFTDSATVSFSAGSVTGNTASAGGAVGVGSGAARLYFSGNVQVINNTLGVGENAPASNVYLNQDSDAIINAGVGNNGLGSSASIGIYVAGELTGDLFINRGVPGAFFATYTKDSNVGRFSNDRLTGLSVQKDTTSKRLFWGKAFTVEVRYLESFSGCFPTVAAGTVKNIDNKTSITYYAPSSSNAASEIADDLRSAHTISNLSGTAVFGAAFVGTDRTFANYITNVNWDSVNNHWSFIKRDGTEIPGDKLVVYFTEPSYISIENNTQYPLNVSALTVLGQNAINSASDTGYGYVFAVNGVIKNNLQPITAADLMLQPGKNIKLLFPGGKNAAWNLRGGFDGASTDIPCKLNGTDGTITAAEVGNFQLNGTTLNTNGGTYEIIFGSSKAICKIVTEDVGPLLETDVVAGKVPGESSGTTEYTFSKLRDAVTFITNHSLTTADIEMLVDYLIPGSDVVSLPAGYDITFTTATSGQYKYSDDANARAVISRDQGNNASFISVLDGNRNTTLTVKNLIFDGKNFGGDSISGGVIRTKAADVVIDNVVFQNCVAKFGGGIYIESVNKNSANKTPYGSLTVTNSSFIGCSSTHSEDKYGGGAIWTSMQSLTVTNCSFTSCHANRQAGAVFHYVGGNYDTWTNISGSTFAGCDAQAAGSLESGAKYVTITDCSFQNSTATQRNGGAVNVWALDQEKPTADCYVTLDQCTFENCYALVGTGNNGNGGAMRSTATHNTIINCTFTNTVGNDGGAINIFNGNAVDTTISGCTFSSCAARNRGGAIYCVSKEFTVDSTSSIQNCTATNAGGGIYHGRIVNGSSLAISSAAISNCYSQNAAGGGIYSSAQMVSLSGVTVENCSSPKQGGGIYHVPGNDSASSCSVTDSLITGNSATEDGGGLYYNNNNDKGTLTLSFSGSTVSGNTSDGMGGGIYTDAQTTTLSGSTVKDNTAAGNGGGICHNSNSNTSALTLQEGCAVTGNSSGGMGGGVYTLANLALQGTTVTGNSLSHNTAGSAAGIYMRDARTLAVGKTDTGYDIITVTGNKTEDGAPSDLRLPMSGNVNSNSVNVLCDLLENGDRKSEIRVVNALVKGTQFGHTDIPYVGGFNDLNHVFIADDDSLYGIIDRGDSTHKKIIWGMEPICKITDDRGRLLYLKEGEKLSPAVFDYLDKDNGQGTNEVSAFGILRGHSSSAPKLYNADGTAYTGTTYQVKMLVENYTADSAINRSENPDDPGKTIILTTAGSNDSLYPYRGRSGTRATILRGSHENAMITVKSNLTLQNIVLDSGSEAGAPYGANSRILLAETAGTTIRLGKNAALQNAKVSGGAYGAGLRLNNTTASMIIEGGSIRNCSTEQSGGGIQVKNGNLTIAGGSITRCTAADRGGGVYFENGTFTMTGGSITRCSAATGAGVYLANGQTINMSGGSISGNTASSSGGGIAVGGKNARLVFSGAPYVYGNTLSGEACNVQMDQHFEYGSLGEAHAYNTTVIVSEGLVRGATIGVYVPDGTNLYEKHGDIQMPFGTYKPESNTETLNYFINDRNALKGGLYDTQAADNYMIYWVKIYSLKVSKQVISDNPQDTEKEFSFTVKLDNEEFPELDPYLTGIYGEMEFINGEANFTLKSGESITAEKMPFGYGYTITENLSAEEQVYYKTTPALEQKGKMNVEKEYLYEVNFNNIHAICKITDANEGLLYYEKDGKLQPAVYSQLQNAFNALSVRQFYNSDGDPVTVNTPGTNVEMLVDYTLEEGATFGNGVKATLTTADKNAGDGFPYVGEGTTATITRGASNDESMITVNGDLTLGNIVLDGNSTNKTANANGGLLNVPSGGKLTVGSGSVMQNSTTSGNGAGVYLAAGALMNISGAPVFSNNFATNVTLGTDPKNGGDNTVYPNATTAPQDIYIANYSSSDAPSLVVMGNISPMQGFIWVWADAQRHYEQSKQFAVMSGGTYTGLDVFRNARPDTETKNPLKGSPLYLYGISRGDRKVYWSGSMDLSVSKTVTGDFGDQTKAFNFTVYGLDSGVQYDYVYYASLDETTGVPDKLTADTEGKITFTLKHHEKIVISIPGGTEVTVSEENDVYTASYVIGSGESQTGNTTAAFELNSDTTVAFTNNLNAASPTGYHANMLPYALMLATGLLLGAGMLLLPRRRRRGGG